MTTLRSGHGVWVHQTERCAGGNPEKFATACGDLKFQHVNIKVTDGATIRSRDAQFANEVAPELQRRGVQLCLWGYCYAQGDPARQAEVAMDLCGRLGVEVFIVNAEKEFKARPGEAQPLAEAFGKAAAEAGVELWLSTFAMPSLHPEFPWDGFLGGGHFHGFQPQCYGSHPDRQAKEARRAAEARGLEFCPTLRAYVGAAGDSIGEESTVVGLLGQWSGWKNAPGIQASVWNYWQFEEIERRPQIREAVGRLAV
ncbi:MAG: hypothetical protein NTW86_03700 [Candidatus Sumerlaeota bacterium]|nr:hypothetical protein [Candidatus Sumerlaeota bacterium]